MNCPICDTGLEDVEEKKLYVQKECPECGFRTPEFEPSLAFQEMMEMLGVIEEALEERDLRWV